MFRYNYCTALSYAAAHFNVQQTSTHYNVLESMSSPLFQSFPRYTFDPFKVV